MPPDPLAGLKGPTSNGRGKERREWMEGSPLYCFLRIYGQPNDEMLQIFYNRNSAAIMELSYKIWKHGVPDSEFWGHAPLVDADACNHRRRHTSCCC